jgi:cell division protein FtsZ
MTINLHLPVKSEQLRPTITVIGVGGAGGNAVNNMIASSLEGVNFVVANTDAQALDHSLTERTIQLGAGITKGLGAGANPEVGRAAAEEARDEVSAYIEGSNMVFITAGMGGGTGTGAAPVVARVAKEQGILTVAVVTKPFQFEGTHRMRLAEAGLKELQDYVDTLIIIPNQNLFRIANERTTFADAFKMADEVLHSGVRGVTDLMVKPGLINLDFADIRTVMREMGKAMMGTGEATGERRAIEAAEAAISNPLLDDVSLKGARALLINITGGNDMTLFEVDEAANRVREEVDPDANIIFGSTFNEGMEGRMRVSVVATGIDALAQVNPNPQKSSAVEKKPFAYAPAAAPKAAAAAVVAARPQNFEPSRPVFQPQPQQQEAAPAARPPVEQRSGGAVRQETQAAPQVAVEEPPAPRRVQEYAYEPVEAAAPPPRPPVQEAPAPIPHFSPREQAPIYQEDIETRAVSAAGISPRREYREQPMREDSGTRGFFQRMADVGRALSSGNRAEVSERVHVVQRSPQAEGAERPAKQGGEEDQYLDIPAFLRRQAN